MLENKPQLLATQSLNTGAVFSMAYCRCAVVGAVVVVAVAVAVVVVVVVGWERESMAAVNCFWQLRMALEVCSGVGGAMPAGSCGLLPCSSAAACWEVRQAWAGARHKSCRQLQPHLTLSPAHFPHLMPPLSPACTVRRDAPLVLAAGGAKGTVSVWDTIAVPAVAAFVEQQAPELAAQAAAAGGGGGQQQAEQ